jgi:hypothetical protein
MNDSIIGDTIAEAWLSSLHLFQDNAATNRFDSDRGPCVERENILISVRYPTREPRVAEAYPSIFLPLVEGVSAAFRGATTPRKSTLQERLYAWPRRRLSEEDQMPPAMNQIDLARQRLRDSPNSRFTIAGLWDPDIDPFLANPVSPLLATFRVRNGALNSTLLVRSVDAWMGSFPILVGFSDIHDTLARDSDVKTGSSTFFILSYHIYEIDLPIAMESAP